MLEIYWILWSLSLYSLPWFCVGDFKETMSQEEHVGVNAWPLTRTLEFFELASKYQLEDMGFKGYQ
jgi:hypothetical protein